MKAASDNQRRVNGALGKQEETSRLPSLLQLATDRARAVAPEQGSNNSRPTTVTPWGLSQAEQFRLALPVLEAARQPILDGAEPLDAIAQAGLASIVCEYARRALRAALWERDLLAWQSHPATVQSARTRAMDRAIRLCRRAQGHRGGWTVTAEAR